MHQQEGSEEEGCITTLISRTLQDKEEGKDLHVFGIFCSKGRLLYSDLLKDLIHKDRKNDQNKGQLKTGVRGHR